MYPSITFRPVAGMNMHKCNYCKDGSVSLPITLRELAALRANLNTEKRLEKVCSNGFHIFTMIATVTG